LNVIALISKWVIGVVLSIDFYPSVKESNMRKGEIKWLSLDKGFGFIAPEDESKGLFASHAVI
tara:strand:+ start:64288 stop:64476 length:189 start_codon:yes stop_codon:yes gene_type:complete